MKYSTALLLSVFVVGTSVVAVVPNSLAQITEEAETSAETPTVVSLAISLPEGSKIYGVSAGRTVWRSVSAALRYSYVASDEGDVKIHSFGGGVSIGIVTTTRSFPVLLSLVGSASYMTAASLPTDGELDGESFSVGVGIGRSALLTEATRLGLSITPIWTTASSKQTVEGYDPVTEDTDRLFVEVASSLSMRDYLTIAPSATLGEDLVVPGLSLFIQQRFTVRGEVALYDDLTTPSFSVGYFIR